jgi:hypothetical protein
LGKVQRLSHQQIRQAIKRDELREFIEDTLVWVRGHVENVIIGSVLLAVLGFGLYYLLSSRQEGGVKASLQLAAADGQFQRALSGPVNGQAYAAATAAYQGVKAEFDGKPEGLRAELGLANVDFETGKFEEARAAYESFASQHATHALAPVALAGQAASLEGLNKAAAAAELYLSVSKNYPQAPNMAQCLFDAARLFDSLGQKARVKELVVSLEALQSNARLPESLKARLAALKAKAA